MRSGKWSLNMLERRLGDIEKLLDVGNKIYVHFASEEPYIKESEGVVRKIRLYWPDVSSKIYKSEEKES